jgi:hypothetical protein
MYITNMYIHTNICTEINIGVVPPVWRKWDPSNMDSTKKAAWPSERSGHRYACMYAYIHTLEV